MSTQTLFGTVFLADPKSGEAANGKLALIFDDNGRSEIQIENFDSGEIAVVGRNSPVVAEMASAIRSTLEQVPVGPAEHPGTDQAP